MYNAQFDIVRLYSTGNGRVHYTTKLSTAVEQPTIDQISQSHLPNAHYFPITNFYLEKTVREVHPFV